MNAVAIRRLLGTTLRGPPAVPAERFCRFKVSLGPLAVLSEDPREVLRAPGALRAFSSGNPESETFASFGNRRVPIEEKEKLVGGVFSSVADKYDLMNDLMSVGIHRIWKDHFAELVNFPSLQPPGVPQAAEAFSLPGAPQAAEASSVPGAPQPAEAFSVLDLAGGTGDIAFRLIDRALLQQKQQQKQQQMQQEQQQSCYSGVEVTVCDINGDMLRVGMQRAAERGLPVRPLIDSMSPPNTKDVLLARPSDFGQVGRLGLRWVRASGEALPFVDNSFDLITIAFGLRNFTSPAQGLQEALRTLKPGGRFLCLEFSKVENPIVSPLYDVYSFAALPLLGMVVAGDRGAYQYLVESIRRFPSQHELAGMMQQQGFKHVSYTNMTCGVVAIHSGFKA